MPRIAAAVTCLMMLMRATEAAAEPNYAVWLMAHERMVAKWRHAEPRCGWTVGGNTCASRSGLRRSARPRDVPANSDP
jgi:hypothetical protein